MLSSILEKKHFWHLFLYSVSGSIAAVTDISILYILKSLELLDVLAVCVSVSVSIFVHYTISRYFVFRTFNRSFLSGFIFFVSIVGVSALINVCLYLLLSYLFPQYFVLDRVVSIAAVGLLSFFMNAKYNFKTIAKKTK